MQKDNSIAEYIRLLLEWVPRYLDRGWRVIPIPFGLKHPVKEGWRQLNLSWQEAQVEFSRKSNVGVAIDKSTGNLVVADLDCPEANEIADEFLPATGLEGGRESAPGSHRFYIIDGIMPKNKLKYVDPTISDPKKAMIVEILVNGQVVVAPSVYPDGEKCVWRNFGEAAHIVASGLFSLLGVIAAIVLMSRHWREGIRHNASVYLAGALAHSGYAREEAKKIIAAICRLAKDEQLTSRLNNVDTTFDRFEHGETASGWPTLKEEDLFDPRVVKKAKEWLGRKPKPKKKAKPSLADIVRNILSSLDIIRLGSKEVFVTYPAASGQRTCAIDSEEFDGWLREYFFNNHDHLLDSSSLKSIKAILAGNARLTDQQVHLRVAHQDGTTYIDLNNDEQEIVEITAEGWEVRKL